jgi:hypothetical protein
VLRLYDGDADRGEEHANRGDGCTPPTSNVMSHHVLQESNPYTAHNVSGSSSFWQRSIPVRAAAVRSITEHNWTGREVAVPFMSIDSAYWSLLGADLVLVVHAAFVTFVVFGLVLILIGRALSWSWVRHRVFRLAHLAAIVGVAGQAWLGVVCPLTTLEMSLRRRAGAAAYEGTFISHWLESLLYYDVASWVFVVCYTAFAALVGACWFVVPPDPLARKQRA